MISESREGISLQRGDMDLRIAYVARYPLGSPSGVLDKIVGQAAEWQAHGHSVKLFGLSGDGWSAIPPAIANECASTKGYLGRLWSLPALFRDVASWGPDLIYLRYFTYQPGLGRVFTAAPVVVEVNANDTAEMALVSRMSHVYNLATRSRVLRKASAFVFVTNELASAPSFRDFAQTRTAIGNGVSLAAIPLRAKTPNNDRPRFVFLGSAGCAWHGLDKILRLAAAMPSWQFDIVGGTHFPSRSLSANVTCHGRLTRDRYWPILAAADVAISTLALHREELNEASPLKTREYLAAGVPTIVAYRDTDFLHGAPFLLELPNVEDNILPQIGRIDDFVRRMRGVTVSRSSIAHLDWSEKESLRLAFFRDAVEASRTKDTLG